ncbi:MAG: asparagine synthase (glutamine-hydrolyzing) [Proteobacteria bacterium]|nr:asparagine synthase (glutamine-hydrolyzing) [Pseudomonadota bacterium]
MCGFVTLLNTKKLPITISNLLDTINHRGPDDRGWMAYEGGIIERGKDKSSLSGKLLLGHVRLSIIDLSEAGWQPMSSADGKYHIVFNGEIYNYRELRIELELMGRSFRTQTDTEVLLLALAEWGIDALSKLRGMFAFCFFDSDARELTVARDFFGIKPLFYCKWNGGFAFASEQAPLLALPGVAADIDPQGLYEYLLAGTSDVGVGTMIRGISQIPAASYIKFPIDSQVLPSPLRYWRIDLRNRRGPDFNTACSRVRTLFLDSVEKHLRSDVPIGTALSGGIDSSSIACAVRHLNPKQEIHTFSFIVDDKTIGEESWVDVVNSHINAIPHKVRATNEELVNDLDELILAQGEPFGSTSIYAQFRVFKAAASFGIKVMLDGQGADEMLGGYVSYQGSRFATLLHKLDFGAAYKFFRYARRRPGCTGKSLAMFAGRELLPNWARFLVRQIVSKNVPPKWLNVKWFKSHGVNLRPDFLHGTRGPDHLRERLLETLEVSSLPYLLRYEDRDSMHFSIESRVPFLDVPLVEYLYSLPEAYLISPEGVSKYVFREAMRGIVPDVILDRRDKIGFATPERAWLTKMDIWVKDCLRRAEQLDYFDANEVNAEWQRVLTGGAEFNFRCWRWLNAIEWCSYMGR